MSRKSIFPRLGSKIGRYVPINGDDYAAHLDCIRSAADLEARFQDARFSDDVSPDQRGFDPEPCWNYEVERTAKAVGPYRVRKAWYDAAENEVGSEERTVVDAYEAAQLARAWYEAAVIGQVTTVETVSGFRVSTLYTEPPF